MSLEKDKVDATIQRYMIEDREKWREWMLKIPALSFPKRWQITITPPFAGAMARFLVTTDKMAPGDGVSVYLDVYENLGYFGRPYWEVYPYKGDTGRCAMEETEHLLRMIKSSIGESERANKKRVGES